MNKAMVDLANRLFQATLDGDRETVLSLHTEDAVIWHNTDGKEKPIAKAARNVSRLRQVMPDFRFEDDRTFGFESGFLRLHTSRGTISETGQEITLPTAVVGFVDDGKITRVEEYSVALGI